MFNRQRKLSVRTSEVFDFLEAVSAHLGFEGRCSVVLISDRAMRCYNREFAGKDRPTDVLSFPTDETDRRREQYWGDILISVEAANRQRSGSLETELKILSLHGLLHLQGFDHETDSGEMLELESRLRQKFGLE